MNDWQHTLFSGGDLSNYLIDRWDDFTKEREAATFDVLPSKYLLRVPELDLEKMTIARWGEAQRYKKSREPIINGKNCCGGSGRAVVFRRIQL